MKLHKQSSNTLTRKWNQFWCLHDWKRGFEVDITPFEGFLYEFNCVECEKTICRTMMHAPISGILPETDIDKYKKDPLNNVSPSRDY